MVLIVNVKTLMIVGVYDQSSLSERQWFIIIHIVIVIEGLVLTICSNITS